MYIGDLIAGTSTLPQECAGCECVKMSEETIQMCAKCAIEMGALCCAATCKYRFPDRELML